MPDLIDGRYRLLEVLASGGMATVWRAHDTRLDRRVALKRPHPAPPGDPVHVRIEREARAAASLSHPHLITIFDVGKDEQGPFLVMELVEGPTLADTAGHLDRSEAVEVVARIAEALAAVHAAGIVHRDVKPANVMMSSRGPQLTDFGIAVTSDITSRLTQDGSLVATPSYASPEQLAGEPVSYAGDVFSLGVILYELVSGRLPFTDVDRSRPPAPVGDQHLDSLFARVLSTDPDRRPGAGELAVSLRAAAPTLPTAASGSTVPMAGPASTQGEEQDRSAPRWLAILAGAAVIGIVALAVLALDEDPTTGAPTTGPGDTTPTTSPGGASSTTATTLAQTTTSVVTTTATTATTVVAATNDPSDIEAAREELGQVMSSVHPSVMNPPEVRDLLGKADDAIEASLEGGEEEAGQKLREIAREIDDKLEGETRQEALASLVDLADALGLSLEPDEDRRDDDGDGDGDGDDDDD